MRVRIPTYREVEVTHIRLVAKLLHANDDLPGYTDGIWTVDIGIDDGVIRHWPAGLRIPLNISYNSMDANYFAVGADGEVVGRVHRAAWLDAVFCPQPYDRFKCIVGTDGAIRGWHNTDKASTPQRHEFVGTRYSCNVVELVD
jgi:hypothetical protein